MSNLCDLDSKLGVVSCSRSSRIVESSKDIAGGRISVDGKGYRGDLSFGSKKMLSDVKGLHGGGDAVGLQVNALNCDLCGGPCANNIDSSILGVCSFNASKVLNIKGRIILGISRISGHDNDG